MDNNRLRSAAILVLGLLIVVGGCFGGFLLYNRLTSEDVPLVQEVDSDEIIPIVKTDAEWKAILTPEQYYVTREHGTERPHINQYNKTMTKGVYRCACCELPLFDSEHKFISKSGWPSFYQPIDKKNVGFKTDRSWSQEVRTEVHCKRCKGHLGHVFDDGPDPTGLRYCINSVSINLVPALQKSDAANSGAGNSSSGGKK